MKSKSNRLRTMNLIFLLVVILSIIWVSMQAAALPQGAEITSSTTEDAPTRQAATHTAKGGSFTTLVLNATTQTSSWKAYVGNVTGKITLDNSNNQTLYDWDISAMQGEVFVSRNDTVNFTSIACADLTDIATEETALSITATSVDSINNTFYQKIHKSFVVGGTGLISNSTCYSIATYVNDAVQTADENADFQEVLLTDGNDLVFTALLENSAQGFNNQNFDFQMIVPDNPSATSNTYYFYVELG